MFILAQDDASNEVRPNSALRDCMTEASFFCIYDFLFLSFSGIYKLFSFNNLGIGTENIQTQIKSKRFLIQIQNFKVITMQIKNKRGKKFFLN